MRTYGATRNCKGCRFWSEMIAKCDGGTVLAMCLSGPKHGQYTAGFSKCENWKSGYFGAIDTPGEDILAAYADEEAERG